MVTQKPQDLTEFIKPVPLLETELEKNWITVFYGEDGKRKTTTAARLVNEKGFYITTDNSWKVLYDPMHKEDAKKLDIVFYEGRSQLLALTSEFVKSYDTLILDTGTGAIDHHLDLLLDKGEWKAGKGEKGFRDSLISDDKDLQGIQVLHPMDYRATRDRWRPVWEHLRELEINVVVTCHVNNPMPGLSADKIKRPAMPESTWKTLGRITDVVGMIYSNQQSKLVIDMREEASTHIAKSRMPGVKGTLFLDDFVKKYHTTVFGSGS